MTTNHNTNKELKLSHAMPQEQLPPITISLKELLTERDRYTVRPKYQRETVWNLRQKQQFIDSLLSGDPFPPVEGYEGFGEDGMKMWEIGDGQNRFFTIIEFMLDGFKTWTARQKRAKEPSSNVGPVQPGKFFSEMDVIARNYLFDYHARIDRLRDREESERATRFLRVQNHVPLTAAERLKVYTSKAKEVTWTIEHLPFWQDFYMGKSNRGQLFQSSLYLLALEMAPTGVTDLQVNGYTQTLVSGKYDDKITDGIDDAIASRLDLVSCVYEGGHFTVRATVIAMYQSVVFLEQAGYTIKARDKGKLTKWLSGIIAESNRSSGTPAYNRPLQHLTSAKAQREFWNRHLKEMMSCFKINVTKMEQLPLKKVVAKELILEPSIAS